MPKPKYYPVRLTKKDRKELTNIGRKDGYNGQQRKRADILLALDESGGVIRKQTDIADILGVSVATIHKAAKAFCEGGVAYAISRKKRMTPPVPAKVDGRVEARIEQMACSKAPDGHARWTLRLLEDKVVEADDLPNLSARTIARLLKKRLSSLT